jgi:hypothetical protein
MGRGVRDEWWVGEGGHGGSMNACDATEDSTRAAGAPEDGLPGTMCKQDGTDAG